MLDKIYEGGKVSYETQKDMAAQSKAFHNIFELGFFQKFLFASPKPQTYQLNGETTTADCAYSSTQRLPAKRLRNLWRVGCASDLGRCL